MQTTLNSMAASPPISFLARTPCTAPISTPTEPRQPRVRIRHPGYATNNVLLRMPAIDDMESSVPPRSTTSSRAGQLQRDSATPRTTFGLHHRTALTAGAIIANNTFDRAYFTHDQAGTNRVEVPLDGVLEPGDYWLQLREEKPPSPEANQTTDTSSPGDEAGEAASMTLDSSMPPPPQPPALTQSAPADSQSRGIKCEPYPIVPSFKDWWFPHNRLPSEWKTTHHPPSPLQRSSTQPTNLSPTHTSRSRCCITDMLMGTNRCHVIPSKQSDWFGMNGMREYALGLTGNIDDEANIV
ncbi:hypothetical protein DHEL01_v200500 [Diaporthe helianthi]|uniref:HNH nuclease domain-containing protein n=1 Tax=Diaporthe helianthi TaxID=158607 RepID=A0A2P5IF07_DIAHE|nr:hypothetical protein DHEL01_v200500 [Diaporthe helianthi]